MVVGLSVRILRSRLLPVRLLWVRLLRRPRLWIPLWQPIKAFSEFAEAVTNARHGRLGFALLLVRFDTIPPMGSGSEDARRQLLV
jgi:hypothetical protein